MREFRIAEKGGRIHLTYWVDGIGGKGVIMPKKDKITAKCPRCGKIVLDWEEHKEYHNRMEKVREKKGFR